MAVVADFIGLIDVTVGWVSNIREIVEAAKHNKGACSALLGRVGCLDETLKSMKHVEDPILSAALWRVKAVLEKACNFLKSYESKRRLTRYMFSQKYRKGFAEVGDAVSHTLADFNAAASVALIKGQRTCCGAQGLLSSNTHDIDYRIDSVLESLQCTDLEVSEEAVALPELPYHTVGLEHKVCAVEKMLKNARTVALIGMGGIGKTILSAAVLNKVKCDFDSVTWITIGQEPDILSCQHQLWKQLVKSESEPPFQSVQDGQQKLRMAASRSSSKDSLVVLDDVWKYEHLEQLAVTEGRIKVILTTRKSDIAHECHAQEYKISLLEHEQAMQLFCMRAFRTATIPEDKRQFEECAKGMVAMCGGLPLALSVIAALAASYSFVQQWEIALGKLQESGKSHQRYDDKVLAVLQLSFDALDAEEQDFFLSLAAYPEGYHVKVSDLVEHWVAHKYDLSKRRDDLVQDVKQGYALFGQLMDQSLIQVDRSGIVGFQRAEGDVLASVLGFQECEAANLSCCLHDLIRDMALKIASKGDLSKRQRLFDPCMSILKDTTVEAEQLSISWHEGQPDCVWPDGNRLPALKSCHLMRWGQTGLPTSLLSLPALKMLDVSYSQLRYLPQEISQLKSLHLLRLDGCNIEELPTSISQLRCLRLLSVRMCQALHSLPESIGELEELHSLHVSGSALNLLPASLGNLFGLRRLDMSFCESLEEFPANFGSITQLDCLSVSGCTSLTSLPRELGCCEILKIILASGCTALKNLPKAWPRSLEVLDLQGCEWVDDMPPVTGLLRLKALHLQGCRKLRRFPDSELPSLRVLGLPLLHGRELTTAFDNGQITSFQLNTLGSAGRSVILKDRTWFLEQGDISQRFGVWLQRAGVTITKLPHGRQYRYFQMRAKKLSLVQLKAGMGAKLCGNEYQQATDADECGRTPLHHASRNNDVDAVLKIIQSGGELELQDHDGCTCLHHAAQWGSAAVVGLLLRRGACVNAVNQEGSTPLMEAAVTGNKDIAKMLLDAGADVEAVAKGGWSTLHAAALGASGEIVRLVLKHYSTAPVNARDKEGRTPIMYAAWSKQQAICQMLVDAGAEVDITDKGRRTTLLWGALGGSTDVLKFLLKHYKDAPVNVPGKWGFSPLKLAYAYGHQPAVELLRRAGATMDAPLDKVQASTS